MDSWEFNKIAAAVLSALLVVFGGKEIIHIAEGGHAKHGAKPGYTLPVDTAATASTASPSGAKKGFDFAKFASLLPKASADSGKGVFKKCVACHTPGKGGKNGQGPNLWDIVNRDMGVVDGFKYSSALKEKGGKWDFDALANFIKAPKKWLKGTKMAFAGIKNDNDLADLMAYLRSLSDSPADWPAAQ